MIVAMRGDEELGRRAADLAGRLPEQLASLARVAYNYRWCWYAGGKDVFRSIDEGRWELCGGNPVRLLQEVSGEALARAAGDRALLARVASLEDAFAVGPGAPAGGSGGAGAADRVLLCRVRRARVVADLLGRARRAGGRPAEGGLGSGAAAGGGRVDVPPGVFPPAPGGVRLAAGVLG